MDVQSITLFQPDEATRYFCCLSSQGEVYHNTARGPFTETITGVGVAQGGRLHRITAVDSQLVACGENGQVFIRSKVGNWDAIAGSGPERAAEVARSFETAPPPTDPRFLEWVQSMANPFKSSVLLFAATGTSVDDLYVAGATANGAGILRHHSAMGFADVPVPKIQSISDLMQAPNGTIWACGKGGTILVGNRERGFEDRSTGNELTQFSSLAWYENACWIASVSQPRGLFRCEEGGRPERLAEAPRDVQSLSAVGKVLWAVGQKTIYRLENGNWERIAHPDVK
ncbi:hypothetical protein [Marivita sp. S0852]|uniref:hypothetical protein n=1 Tax=Marivita sp. S0852 TaxID=3373893 RepID=UPI003981D5B9